MKRAGFVAPLLIFALLYASVPAPIRAQMCVGDCDGDHQVTVNADLIPPFPGHWLYVNPDLVLAEVAWQFLSQFELPAP